MKAEPLASGFWETSPPNPLAPALSREPQALTAQLLPDWQYERTSALDPALAWPHPLHGHPPCMVMPTHHRTPSEHTKQLKIAPRGQRERPRRSGRIWGQGFTPSSGFTVAAGAERAAVALGGLVQKEPVSTRPAASPPVNQHVCFGRRAGKSSGPKATDQEPTLITPLIKKQTATGL